MAAAFDVSARLAGGRAALDAAQTYVSASRLRGYTHPDLTRYSGQILDWYSTLDGLDLNALDADCQILRSAAVRCASALNDVRAALVGVPGGWRGQGAAAVTDFLAGQCDTAQRLVDALEISQSSCSALRDELWRQVDRQVSATLAMAEQQRPEWPAAARAVLGGDAGRDDAGEIVDSQVKPFVDKAIGGEWLSTMRSVADAVEEAYRGAIARVGAFDGLVFEVPGGFLPQYVTPREAAKARVAEPQAMVAAPAGLDVPAATAPASPAAHSAAPNALDTITSGLPQPPAMPAFGTAMPTSGLPSWPEFGSAGTGALPQSGLGAMDIPALDVPRLDGLGLADGEPEDRSPGKAESETPAEAEEAEPGTTEAEDALDTEDVEADLQVDSSAPPDTTEPPAEATDGSSPLPDCPPPVPAAEPAPPAEPLPPAPEAEPEPPAPSEPEAPCEVAADELPQVGE